MPLRRRVDALRVLLRAPALRVAFLRVAFLRVAFLRVAFFRVAFLRVAVLRVAFLRVVFLRVAFLRVVLRADVLRATLRFGAAFAAADFFLRLTAICRGVILSLVTKRPGVLPSLYSISGLNASFGR